MSALLSQEHYDLIIMFEREFSGRFEKENKSMWAKGHVYQDGTINNLFIAYRKGYAFGKVMGREE